MAKLVPITAPIHITKANPSIMVYVIYYKLSIHFWPDFVLSQMAKQVPIKAPSPINIVYSSILFIVIVILHNSVCTIRKYKSCYCSKNKAEYIIHSHLVTGNHRR